jgi:hypothetical protein
MIRSYSITWMVRKNHAVLIAKHAPIVEVTMVQPFPTVIELDLRDRLVTQILPREVGFRHESTSTHGVQGGQADIPAQIGSTEEEPKILLIVPSNVICVLHLQTIRSDLHVN